ncbi:GNAT family N-acetyltransferase [Legionella worsleiensis]|uniref:GNAT family acetyltransferase n=1 Tax=Legionella worsleiensis TaxID=45076 RepID=A0A0W1A5V1_9GAMM|nr:GNAT family N-acetyltransferase [Legionella worsleiensis]KTD76733.1 GNAT family acetyltransferase [Legionella worsleiensis]STY30521.1 GNAT family acetyltransferase [Legionella worsleiensis]
MNKKNTAALVRMAKVDDAPTIAEIHVKSWQEMYKEFIPESILQELSVEERTLLWTDLIRQNVRVLVIEMHNKVVGFVSICALRDAPDEGEKGEISAIYLHPDYWRLGLGTQLCRAALSELSRCHFKSVHLWVLSDNQQARKFYESLGFMNTRTTKIDEFYQGGALLEEIMYMKVL